MNKAKMTGNWKEIKGKIQSKWGDLTDSELDKLNGNFEQIKGKIVKKYGESEEKVHRELSQHLNKFLTKTKETVDDTFRSK